MLLAGMDLHFKKKKSSDCSNETKYWFTWR